VRRAGVADAPAIAALHVRSWQWAYRGLIPDSYLDGLNGNLENRTRWWADMLRDDSKWTWVAERDGQMVGFTDTFRSSDKDASESTAMLGAIYLERSEVRKGVGRALMDRAIANLQAQGFAAVTLWVLDTNAPARRFYEALGWQQDGATKTERRPGFDLKEVRYHLDVGR
jgi:GNAT superfamily N-acetyltransferase